MAYLLVFICYLKTPDHEKDVNHLYVNKHLLVMYSCGPSEVVVTNRPSPPVYVRSGPPGSVYVWRDGDWVARGGQYHWQEGRWVKPRHRVYVPGHWVPRGNGWYWRRGYWK